MAIDLEDIKHLIDLAAQSGVATLDMTKDGMRVRIETGRGEMPTAAVARTPAAAAPARAPAAAVATVEAAEPAVIRAPTDGLIHLAPSPGAAPFVSVGQAVRPGDTVCVIEVMKMFYPVPATMGGTVRAIRVEEGQQVGFDEVLLDLA